MDSIPVLGIDALVSEKDVAPIINPVGETLEQVVCGFDALRVMPRVGDLPPHSHLSGVVSEIGTSTVDRAVLAGGGVSPDTKRARLFVAPASHGGSTVIYQSL